MSRAKLKQRVISEVNSLFEDTSVPLEKTLQDLKEVRDLVDSLIDALTEDLN
jgi:hypothetical protein